MGSRILAGRYELLERIGEGGMAVVFKARDRLLGRMVAVKILRPEYTKDAVFIENFRKESQTAASIVHQNIVNVYDVGKEGNIHYIVMELVDGKPLSDIIRDEGPLEPHRAVSIARQVAAALSVAHKHSLIHRDVKPHNILVTSDGVAKLSDFGIAKTVTQDTLAATTSDKKTIMGSVHYFSPEQARGGYVDEKSDIYSLGIVLYEMITGKVPFDGETAVEVAVKHMNEEMIPPTQINPDCPKDVEDIIARATNKLQVNRYKSADEMITALNFVKFSRHAPFPEETESSASGTDTRSAGESEDDDDDGNSGIRRYSTLIAIVLAIALAIPASRFIYNFFNTDEPLPASLVPEQSTEIEVPKLTDLSEDEARSTLRGLGLNMEVELELASDKYEAGQVMSQTPSEGAKVKAGYTVKVNVSKGQVDGKVPALEGKALSGAKHIIQSYGYEVGRITEENSEDVPVGAIISQDPARGTSLAAGGLIDLVVSLGPEKVPAGKLNVIGMSVAQAQSEMQAIGVSMGAIKYETDETVEKDHIISQSPDPETELNQGDVVDLVVSDYEPPAPVTDPEPPVSDGGEGGDTQPPDDNTGGSEPAGDDMHAILIPVDFSAAANEDFLLTINVADGIYDARTPISQLPCKKSDKYMKVSVSGAGTDGKIYIFFDNQLVYDYHVNFEQATYY